MGRLSLLGAGHAGYNPKSALGSDLIAWWDADSRYWGANGGMTIATGVSSWRDIVAGYAATQGTGSAQPAFSATSFNGAPGVSFDGADDALACADAALLAALPSGSAGSEIWVLAQQDALVADTTERYASSCGGTSIFTGRGLARVVATSNRGRIRVGDGGGAPSQNETTIDLSTRHVLRGTFASGTNALTVDSASAANLTTVPSTTNTRVRIGANPSTAANLFWQGQISVVLYTLPLSAAKAAALAAWLLTRRRL